MLLSSLTGAAIFMNPGSANADIAQDITRKFLRPDELTPQQAVVILMDARSTLKEIQVGSGCLGEKAALSPLRLCTSRNAP